MKNLSFLAVFMFLLGIPVLQAQNLYFCDNFSDEGEPLGAVNSKTFDSRGGYVYFLYDNGKKKIKSKVLIISIAVQKDNGYSHYDTRVFEHLNNDKTWAVHDYNFVAPGNYRVIIQDGKKKELAKGFISVVFKETRKKDHDYARDEDENEEGDFGRVDDNYYKAEMTFTSDVQHGKPVDDLEVYTMRPSGGSLYFFVMNDRALSSAGINLIIHRMNEKNYHYEEKITNEPYIIDGKLKGTYIRYTFTKAGKYKVQVTNKDDIHIATGYVTVQVKD